MQMIFETALGIFGIEANDRAVTSLHFPGFVPDGFGAENETSELLQCTRREILEYLDGNRREFSIPLEPEGSEFMRAAWDELLRIEFGTVVTYGDVAKALGKPGASRAVGMACANNPIPLLIPCHRVMGGNGKLTGFSAGGVELKRRLIELEARGLFSRRFGISGTT